MESDYTRAIRYGNIVGTLQFSFMVLWWVLVIALGIFALLFLWWLIIPAFLFD